MEGCENCDLLEDEIEQLIEELSRLRKRHLESYRVIRQLRSALAKEMEKQQQIEEAFLEIDANDVTLP